MHYAGDTSYINNSNLDNQILSIKSQFVEEQTDTVHCLLHQQTAFSADWRYKLMFFSVIAACGQYTLVFYRRGPTCWNGTLLCTVI